MPISNKDYVERMIEQVGEALRQILKLRRAKKLEEATEQVRTTAREALGMEYSTLIAIDAAAAASLLGTSPRIRVLASLVLEEADVLDDKQAADLAANRRALALELIGHARKLSKNAVSELDTLERRARKSDSDPS